MAKNQNKNRMPAKAPIDQLFESAPPEAKRLLQTYKAEKRNEDRRAFLERTSQNPGGIQ